MFSTTLRPTDDCSFQYLLTCNQQRDTQFKSSFSFVHHERIALISSSSSVSPDLVSSEDAVSDD